MDCRAVMPIQAGNIFPVGKKYFSSWENLITQLDKKNKSLRDFQFETGFYFTFSFPSLFCAPQKVQILYFFTIFT